MSGFVFHPEALADLDEIWEFIAKDDLDAADRLVAEIFDAIRKLVDLPRQGTRRPELTSQPLRFKRVQNYLIAYAPEQTPLWVVAVMHGRRNPRVMAALLRVRETA